MCFTRMSVCITTVVGDGLCCSLTDPCPRMRPVVNFRDLEVERESLKLTAKLGSGCFGDVHAGITLHICYAKIYYKWVYTLFAKHNIMQVSHNVVPYLLLRFYRVVAHICKTHSSHYNLSVQNSSVRYPLIFLTFIADWNFYSLQGILDRRHSFDRACL
jgi:hypothetical protein